MLILGHDEVRAVLDGQEDLVLAAVRDAYVHHAAGRTVLPHSVFLRFPGQPRDRVIGLPGFLDGDDPTAGMKWIASFPGNVAAGLERASAAIILNSTRTGRPVALVEGSVISARRTAASAALAAATLRSPYPETGVALVGTGVIAAEVLRFLRVVNPALRDVTVFDLDRTRAESFAARAGAVGVTVADGLDAAIGAHRLVVLATTAGVPHTDLSACRPGTLVLHLSLRDVVVDAVLAAVNVVDDEDHVCRADTSVHLTEQQVGHRRFIAATLPDLLAGGRVHQREPDRVTLFSPFGLGVLDLAVAAAVVRRARQRELGTELPGFLPAAETA